MADTCDEIATYLGSVSPTLGTIVKRELPARPDAVLVVTNYGGFPAEHGFGTPGIKYENVGIQLKSRGTNDDPLEPYARIQRAFLELAKIQAMTLSGTKYLFAIAMQSPFPLMKDSNNRTIYAVNFIFTKEPSA